MRMIRVFGHHVSLPVVLLSMVDALAAAVALHVAVVANREGEVAQIPFSAPAFIAVLLIVIMWALGLYQMHQRTQVIGILLRTALAFIAIVPAVWFLLRLLSIEPSISSLLVSGVLAFAAVTALHTAFFSLADAGLLRRRVLVLGTGKEIKPLFDLRRRADRRGFEVLGFVASDGEAAAVPGYPLFKQGDLPQLVERHSVHEIVVALSEHRDNLPVHTLIACRFGGARITDIGDFIEREAGKVRLDVLRPSRLAFDGRGGGRTSLGMKRFTDVAASVFLLALAWPLMVATVVAIKAEEGRRAPMFYRQRRVGLNGKEFNLIKFRSMRVDAEADGRPRFAEHGDARVTRVGRIIRKARIDELPQLINVLRGDMSLVGPRPERPEFVHQLEREIPFYQERHRIKPGVTGWAQLLYPYGSTKRDAVEKLQFDLYYVKNRSLLLDLVVLLQTVEVVLFGKGAR